MVNEFPLTRTLWVEIKPPSPHPRLFPRGTEGTRHSKQKEAQAPLALSALGQPQGGTQGIKTNGEDIVSTYSCGAPPHACLPQPASPACGLLCEFCQCLPVLRHPQAANLGDTPSEPAHLIFTPHFSSTSHPFPVRVEEGLSSFPFPVTQPRESPHPWPCQQAPHPHS